ncbi:MAG TPA: SusD/RagB family nutrient-binding outer membrane lipoprotein [Dysgonamonadaceae bacterium]|nr:SusD/RagB family nutrient-binding outer membrane lipoprotein [Dysgonamonadaceae bacterium]
MRTLIKTLLVFLIILFPSCEENLTELNINHNGVDPSNVNPNLILPTIISSTALPYSKGNYNDDFAGVMQYVQKSGWGNVLNLFQWENEETWDYLYGNLRDADHLYKRAGEEGMEFQQGIAIVIRAFNFGYIADTWGDAPYSAALNALNGEEEDMFPKFDSQESIYKGIIEELKTANTLFSKSEGEYTGISPDADILYGGKPVQWRKFTNSLMLRYYMRLSAKLPDYAKAGIEEVVSNASLYPIFTSVEDGAILDYIGSSRDDSWPEAVAFDATESNFTRIQLCAGFRDVLVDYNDPRIGVWFNKVVIPLKISTQYGDDQIVDGVRYLHPDYLAENNLKIYNKETWVADIKDGKQLIDTMEYAGLPIASTTGGGSGWNLNPQPIQGGPNVHNSALADMYKESSGEFLKARLISYAEVSFILAEAAQKGWSVGGTQKDWYEKGVKASFDTWGVADKYTSYIAGEDVKYDGSLEQIMVQKWIANWTVAHESWCDWRRTGYPKLSFGPKGYRNAMPLRYKYGSDEKARNDENYKSAIQNLQETPFTATDGKDSSWSKFWLLQGTANPY